MTKLKDMLNNPIGVFLYLIIRNDISWDMLSQNEKEIILKANQSHNVERDDYKNPEKYGLGRNIEGENWDSFQLLSNDLKGQTLFNILKQENPKKVLEIGTGAGFYTRLICEYPGVEHYTAIDIGKPFLDYLNPKLEKIKLQKHFSYNLICGNFIELNLSENYDFLVLLSTVHHIPNRIELFNKIYDLLSQNGIIFRFDPSHYLLRILHLFRMFIFKGFLKKKFYLNINNLSTHHMCTLFEYKKIS